MEQIHRLQYTALQEKKVMVMKQLAAVLYGEAKASLFNAVSSIKANRQKGIQDRKSRGSGLSMLAAIFKRNGTIYTRYVVACWRKRFTQVNISLHLPAPPRTSLHLPEGGLLR